MAAADGQDRVLATAQQILSSLKFKTSGDTTRNFKIIFSKFDDRLSDINLGADDIDGRDRFVEAEKVILRCDSSTHSLHWEDSPNEADQYLKAVDEILRYMENIPPGDDMDRAANVLEMAMLRLEDEFQQVLIRNAVPLDLATISGSYTSVSFLTVGEFEDFRSFGEDDRRIFSHKRGSTSGDDSYVDLIHPAVVLELCEIAYRMIRCGYEQECSQVYSSVRREVLDETMSILGIEKLSIEEVQKLDWKSLDDKMKKWVQATRVVVRVLLYEEKQLCDQIFSSSDLVRNASFIETVKGCVMLLLNFGEAIVVGKRSPEKLFCIMLMYDALNDVFPELEALFIEESEILCTDAKRVLAGLGQVTVATFVQFEKSVHEESSKKPIHGADIHPLTRYVMNYANLLVDYSKTLNLLLKDSTNEFDRTKIHDFDTLQLERSTPIGIRLLSLINSLIMNLEKKSNFYNDNGMRYIFLMNNFHYIFLKVKNSEIRNLLGDQWVRNLRGQTRQYSTSYLRTSWTKAVHWLKDEGLSGSSSNASKTILKQRFKNFNACFEEIYSTQTAWKVNDPQLREELRISVSERVLPAYRSFMGRFKSQLEGRRHAGKYIKYSPDDLEHYAMDLFEGTAATLNHVKRKTP